MSGNFSIDYQRRCYIDSKTKHPFKIEYWQKTQHSQEYELTTFTEITYPTENQVLQAIDQAGF